MLTFPTPAIKAISLVPLNSEETGGRFRVWLFPSAQEPPVLIWDRKVEGGFPELKVLVSINCYAPSSSKFRAYCIFQKQRIRDRIQPGTSLGHSDKK